MVGREKETGRQVQRFRRGNKQVLIRHNERIGHRFILSLLYRPYRHHIETTTPSYLLPPTSSPLNTPPTILQPPHSPVSDICIDAYFNASSPRCWQLRSLRVHPCKPSAFLELWDVTAYWLRCFQVTFDGYTEVLLIKPSHISSVIRLSHTLRTRPRSKNIWVCYTWVRCLYQTSDKLLPMLKFCFTCFPGPAYSRI